MKPFQRPPKFSIGLDFGTTTSRICYLDNTVDLQVPPKIRPLRSLVTPMPLDTPDQYAWYSGDDVLTGFWAHYSRFKLHMGRMEAIDLMPRRSAEETIAFRPEILTAHIMWALYTRTCTEKRELRAFKDVTVTVPAEWDMIQRQATVLAARIAGFGNVHLIEEPIAAFLAMNASHSDDRITRAKNTLVFDCGGGTLDITVVHRPDQRTWPLITGHARRQALPYVSGRAMNAAMLAGEAIDELLTKTIIEKETWEKIAAHPGDLRCLANIVRQLKESLNPEDRSRKPNAEAPWKDEIALANSKVTFAPKEIVLTLEQMRKVTDEVAEQAKKYIRAALARAGIVAGNVDAVIMVGGSSYLNSMQRCIESEFKNLKWDNGIYLEQPEAIVAIGAALYQADLDRGRERFGLRLPMDTYLSYQKQEGNELRWRERNIGNPKDNHLLPFESRWPHLIVSIPKGLQEIHWTLHQKHGFSEDVADVIEQITFEKYNGQPDHLKLEYGFDINGCLHKWRPSLIMQDSQPITGSPRRYDWQDEDPNALARKYSIDNSPQWKEPLP